MSAHMTYRIRLKIESYLKSGMKQIDIAKLLGYNRASICREIKRGLISQINQHYIFTMVYDADAAQRNADYQKTAKGANLKISHDYKLVDYLEQKIMKEKYSPAASLEHIQIENLQFDTTLSTSTVYNYIRKGLFLKLKPKHLPRKGAQKHKHEKVPRVCYYNATKPSIEDREPSIYSRATFGHWEMDTVIGKKNGKKNVLLVLTERKTRYEIIIKINGKSMQYVTKAVQKLKRKYGNRFKHMFKTITVDNGTEFSDYDNLSKMVSIYYCHPFASCERGSNENQNGMIRRWIPKGTDIAPITHKSIKAIETWLNNYPRKLYHSTAAIQFAQEVNALSVYSS